MIGNLCLFSLTFGTKLDDFDKMKPIRAKMHEIDTFDRKLLECLQFDGRMTLSDLADKVGLSSSPCLRRIRMLEHSGIIARYVALVDQKKVGLPVSVFVSIKLENQRKGVLERFAKAIASWPEVLECYLMTGPRDYLIRIVVADLEAYEQFLKEKLTRLEGIASIESSFALQQVKYTNVLPIRNTPSAIP